MYLVLQGFTLGYWKCIACLIALFIFWKAASLVVLICLIRKFQ